MAQASYEYECMRAELLGKPKPDFEEFQQKWKEAEENRSLVESEKEEEDNLENEQLKEAEAQGEALKGTTGKLDELNNILFATQKRLDRFKVRCGSVTEIIRTKIGGISVGISSETAASTSSSGVKDQNEDEENWKNDDQESDEQPRKLSAETNEKKSQLGRALDNHVDRLDDMLDKAEKAQYAMQNQRKQMRSPTTSALS